MEVRAIARSVHVSPRKIRLVADTIRKLSINDAIVSLGITHKRGASVLSKTLKSALANATVKKLDPANLQIARIDVVEGPQIVKRYHPSTRGRIHPYKKRMSHVAIILENKKGEKILNPKS